MTSFPCSVRPEKFHPYIKDVRKEWQDYGYWELESVQLADAAVAVCLLHTPTYILQPQIIMIIFISMGWGGKGKTKSNQIEFPSTMWIKLAPIHKFLDFFELSSKMIFGWLDFLSLLRGWFLLPLNNDFLSSDQVEDSFFSTTSISSSRVSRDGLHTISHSVRTSPHDISNISSIHCICASSSIYNYISKSTYLSFPHLHTEWRQKSTERASMGSLAVLCLGTETWWLVWWWW